MNIPRVLLYGPVESFTAYINKFFGIRVRKIHTGTTLHLIFFGATGFWTWLQGWLPLYIWTQKFGWVHLFGYIRWSASKKAIYKLLEKNKSQYYTLSFSGFSLGSLDAALYARDFRSRKTTKKIEHRLEGCLKAFPGMPEKMYNTQWDLASWWAPWIKNPINAEVEQHEYRRWQFLKIHFLKRETAVKENTGVL